MKPAATKPVGRKSAAKKPLAKKPMVKKPAAKKFVAKKSIAKKAAAAKKTAARKPIVKAPRVQPTADPAALAAKRRFEGKAVRPEEKVPTYQNLLDESLAASFPASDPIAPSAAVHTKRRIRTGKDDPDWTLQPGGDDVPAKQSQPRSGRRKAGS